MRNAGALTGARRSTRPARRRTVRRREEDYAPDIGAEALVRRIAQYGYTRFRARVGGRWIYLKQITRAEYESA